MDARIWIAIFANEIDESKISHQWILSEDKNLNTMDSAKKFSQTTFGSFCCLDCRRSWNSSKVFILFDMELNKFCQYGNVTMRIFRQECQRCRLMKEPTIPTENIKRVISNIVNYIQREFYGIKNENSFCQPRRFGKQEGPHDEELCEACQNNLCERQDPSMLSQGSSGSGLLPALAIGVGVGVLGLMFLSAAKRKESRRGAP